MRKRWWAAALAVGGVGLVVLGAQGWKAWRAEWERRHPDEARIARYEKVFDVAWKTVDEKYYDPNFDHARWRQVRDVYRPHVRDAKSDVALYVNILTNMMNLIGTSHVSVSMPIPTVSAVRSEPGAPSRKPKPAGCGVRYLTSDLGFDFTEVRRGNDARLVVTDVRRGSAAERAGVAPDDTIRSLKVGGRNDDCPSAEITLQTVGQAPRNVAFTVEDRPSPPPVQRIDLPSGVRVLRFDRFDRDSLAWLRANLPEASTRGLVLDLRHNSGGKVWVERELLSHFLPPGAVTGRVVRRGRENVEKTVATKRRFDGPLAVLVGPMSASAAEVSSAALRYHRRALLVGSETAGAVLMSRGYPLPGGGRVQVAIADWRATDGRRLEGVGVKPDLAVAQTLEAIRAGRDLPLEAAERAVVEGRWRP